jgi:hypothetical protein
MNRKEYMAEYSGKTKEEQLKIFRVYYGQFVNAYVKQVVLNFISLNRIMNSTDKHFNDIPLVMWYSLFGALKMSFLKKNMEINNNNCVSLADIVCMAKEAARQIKEEHEAKQKDENHEKDNQ